MRFFNKFFLLILFFCANVGLGFAQTAPKPPKLSNFIVDQAEILDPATEEKIQNIAAALNTETTAPVFVLTITSLADFEAEGVAIENYAAAVFTKWGIGTADQSRGVLLLVSLGDRQARIEFGEGWNNQYDAEAQEIMETRIIPRFKQDDYPGGILAGVEGLESVIRGLGLSKPPAEPLPWWAIPVVIAGIIGLGIFIYSLFKSGKKGWAWSLLVVIGIVLFFVIRAMAKAKAGRGGGKGGGGGGSGSW